MFLYTSFTDSEGYFCSLLISNIFLSTSHSTDFLSSGFLISTPLHSLQSSIILEKRDPFMHQNLFSIFRRLFSVGPVLKINFSLQTFIYIKFTWFFLELVLLFVCAVCYTLLSFKLRFITRDFRVSYLYIGTTLSFLIKPICFNLNEDLVEHRNHLIFLY